MIWKGDGTIKAEKGEPALRSCWECNGAHEHLKDTGFMHVCFSCGRPWILGSYLDVFETGEKLDEFFKSKGLKPGDSTQAVTRNNQG